MSILLHDSIISHLHLLVIGANLAILLAILLDIDLAILFSPAFFAIFIHYFYIFHYVYPFKSAKKHLKYLIKSDIIEEKDMKESDNRETKEKKFKF